MFALSRTRVSGIVAAFTPALTKAAVVAKWAAVSPVRAIGARRELAKLAELSDHELKDFGLLRSDLCAARSGAHRERPRRRATRAGGRTRSMGEGAGLIRPPDWLRGGRDISSLPRVPLRRSCPIASGESRRAAPATRRRLRSRWAAPAILPDRPRWCRPSGRILHAGRGRPSPAASPLPPSVAPGKNFTTRKPADRTVMSSEAVAMPGTNGKF